MMWQFGHVNLRELIARGWFDDSICQIGWYDWSRYAANGEWQ